MEPRQRELAWFGPRPQGSRRPRARGPTATGVSQAVGRDEAIRTGADDDGVSHLLGPWFADVSLLGELLQPDASISTVRIAMSRSTSLDSPGSEASLGTLGLIDDECRPFAMSGIVPTSPELAQGPSLAWSTSRRSGSDANTSSSSATPEVRIPTAAGEPWPPCQASGDRTAGWTGCRRRNSRAIVVTQEAEDPIGRCAKYRFRAGHRSVHPAGRGDQSIPDPIGQKVGDEAQGPGVPSDPDMCPGTGGGEGLADGLGNLDRLTHLGLGALNQIQR